MDEMARLRGRERREVLERLEDHERTQGVTDEGDRPVPEDALCEELAEHFAGFACEGPRGHPGVVWGLVFV